MRFLKKFPKSNEIANRLQVFFDSSRLEDLARRTGFVKRESPMTGAKFAQLCISGISDQGLVKTLSELCTIGQKLGVDICEQSLNERFNESGVNFLKALFELACAYRLDSSILKVLESFTHVKLEDSTVCTLAQQHAQLYAGYGGNASDAAVKFDFTYDLKTEDFSLQILEGKRTDQRIKLPDVMVAKSLWLRDLGYFKISDFIKIDEAESFFVSRLRSGTYVYLSDNEEAKPINLLKMSKKMKVNEIRDLKVFIGAKARFATRLILQRVPKKVADRRQQKLRKLKSRQGKKSLQSRLDECTYSAFITNLEIEKWPADSVIKIYKVRWQIEILFKVWKSILKVGHVQKMKGERLNCLLYAQLIWVILNMNIFQSLKRYFWNHYKIEISELKGFKLIRSFHKELIQAIIKNQKTLYEQCLNSIFKAIARFGIKQYKKNNPNPLFIYENP